MGNTISVSIPADERGFTGRECPKPDCEGYFKIELGTGLSGDDLPCHCPYCGHVAGHDHFWTKEQIEYAQSIALRSVADALHRGLKKMQFDHQPRGAFGIGISMRVTSRAVPIHHYREKQLETEVVCINCALRYSVYGVFAFCPDCGEHNSLQILDSNLELINKMLLLASTVDLDVAEKLLENALEDCVSAFDGFGRELCRIHASKARNPSKTARVSFQNLDRARASLLDLFDIDLSSETTPEDWHALNQAFQRRHVVAHRMGVADNDYVAKAGDVAAVAGRKVRIDEPGVRNVAVRVRALAFTLVQRLQQPAPGEGHRTS